MIKPPFDPRQLSIDAIAGEAALPRERLNAAWLRQRFAEQPAWTPEAAETSYQLRDDGSPATPASVLIPLVQREGGLTILLTQRNPDLTDHPGQISFPGGRAEAWDASPVDTALRESEEEIGLARSQVEVIGTLPDHYIATGYRVTPVVGLVATPLELVADPGEVAEIFEVPLAFLMDGLNHQRLSFVLPSGRRNLYAMPYEQYYIWGATAGMLRNLFHFLRA